MVCAETPAPYDGTVLHLQSRRLLEQCSMFGTQRVSCNKPSRYGAVQLIASSQIPCAWQSDRRTAPDGFDLAHMASWGCVSSYHRTYHLLFCSMDGMRQSVPESGKHAGLAQRTAQTSSPALLQLA